MNLNEEMKAKLIGTWINDPSDLNSENVQLDFHDDGRLIYTIIGNNQDKNIMHLTFYIDGNFIITDQPSSPREEKTKFLFESSNQLILDYYGQISKYIRYK